jgi:hypothetical protein
VYKKQLLTYLRLTNCRLGLVTNFGAEMKDDGIARVANGLSSESLSTQTEDLTPSRKAANGNQGRPG